jgi:ATP-dependent helicase YprA (DUF1998 family)
MISDVRLQSGPGFEMDSLKKLALITVICAVARHFSYPHLRTSQLKSIVAFCQGKDVFVSLPTGFGKTLIYALLPALFNLLRAADSSIVMVVSPLVALMAEQKCKYVIYTCGTLSLMAQKALIIMVYIRCTWNTSLTLLILLTA